MKAKSKKKKLNTFYKQALTSFRNAFTFQFIDLKLGFLVLLLLSYFQEIMTIYEKSQEIIIKEKP